MGRFTSPDEPLTYADPSNPQSWNLYSYASNNPLALVDNGHFGYCPNGTESSGKKCNPSSDNPPVDGDEDSDSSGLQFSWVRLRDQATTAAQQTWNYVSNPANWQYPGCVMGKMGTWGATGTAGGAAVGSLGVFAGGVGEFLTVPTGGRLVPLLEASPGLAPA